MLPDLDVVTKSYHRCLYSDGFIDAFYDCFLAKSPEVAEKFRETDFTRQKLMLRESLLMMVLFNMQNSEAIDELHRLAKRHSRHEVDIPPHLYELWLDALCEAVETHDSEVTPEVLRAWREAMRPGIELMISGY